MSALTSQLFIATEAFYVIGGCLGLLGLVGLVLLIWLVVQGAPSRNQFVLKNDICCVTGRSMASPALLRLIDAGRAGCSKVCPNKTS